LESSKRIMASTIVETSSSPQNLPATIVFHLYTMSVHQGLDGAGIQRLAFHMDTSQLPWPLWPRRRAQNKLKRVLVHVEVALVPPLHRVCRRASPCFEAPPLCCGAQPAFRPLAVSALPLPWVAGASKASPSSATNAENTGSVGLTQQNEKAAVGLFCAEIA
jgi:hypothetical protein